MATPSTAASSYAAKLKDPRWQRKRLEILQRSDWSCESCGDRTSTLHVHHKQYIKGREPWEYEASGLEALCEKCHSKAHDEKTFLTQVISEFPSEMAPALAALLVGYGFDDGYVEAEHWIKVDGRIAQAGVFASLLGNLTEDQVFELCDAFHRLGPDEFMQAFRDAMPVSFRKAA